MQEVVIVSAVRTAIGSFGGSLKDLSPTELGVVTAEAAIARSGLEPADIQHAFYGNVVHTEPRDMYLARTISVEAGVPTESAALTVNRLCGSGLQAIISGVQTLALGDANIVLAGGAECMSRGGYLMPTARWGQKMGDAQIIDMMIAVLNDPFGHGHMGITAENVAEKFGISREQQDAFAVESHRRAAAGIEAGHFDDQIVPVSIKTRKGTIEFKTDEHVRGDASVERMASLRPAFKKDGKVTAGNASGINDGAASLVLMTADEAARRNLKPMAKVLSYGHAGVAPHVMGIGPVPAMQIALRKAGLSVGDLNLVESNEAFASQACAVTAELGLDPAIVNPNGGAVALGHPVGASGAIITTKLLHEMKRREARIGAATMCIGGGQGIALIVENI
ncbi:acetyl-CoA C-acyltransferase family protein [Marinovum sp. 2_MG-2023]|uniref:acetyl-CoA C-acyltransferase family protein n=1 Tax=Roseobacteraceae TaxID=2854170 RepID=UPI001FD14383|nr:MULTISPECIES: acetyl-CoA C-acyltransferase family protein [Roseobacteraceae]MCJ7873404.1 acetyl-CoA C-acyltransferase family protein [Phaeobacter sp. J2-8]MDO6732823.1 acetyl-CoA C-acyltransferase family protein [Marinovum sp. 2_MG-2023]MDO6782095.1 acetyl-CoA C-acyltransferase family protein [Marinovum sp. 1_MG-2023]